LSVRHPARIVLVGSGNPEEGELRPQLLDRFGLAVEVRTPTDVKTRVEVVRRRDAFERDPQAFVARWQAEEARIRDLITAARKIVATVEVGDEALLRATQLCLELGTDGLRGELTMMRAARALAALEASNAVDDSHLRRVAPMTLSHRLRRNPMDDSNASVRVERGIEELFGRSGERHVA
jgi:magnesium chelatase subunit I